MPVFIAKYNEIREDKAKEFDDEQGGTDINMLGTIKIPKNLRLLTERLPKSNYANEKIQKTKEVVEEPQINQVVSRRDSGIKLVEIKEEVHEEKKIELE